MPNPKSPRYKFKKAWSFNPGTPVDGISADWLAGFWEGEGHFSLVKAFHKKRNQNYWNIVVAISQSKYRGKEVIEKIQKTLGYGRVYHRPEGYRGRKEDWRFLITNRLEAKRFIETIYPFLKFRREEVDEKLALLRDIESGSEEYNGNFQKSWSWPVEIEEKVRSLCNGFTLHVCSGDSVVGDVRVDLSKPADIRADMFHLPIRRDSFDTVLCDPPWHLPYHLRGKVLRELRDCIKPGGRLVFNCFWFPKTRGLSVDPEIFVGVPNNLWRNASLLITARRMALDLSAGPEEE